MSGKADHVAEEVSRTLLQREQALKRFAKWEQSHPRSPTPQAALSGVGLLYDLLPREARCRAVDTTGVGRLHRCLAVLTDRPR